jgi:hypothetical protein
MHYFYCDNAAGLFLDGFEDGCLAPRAYFPFDAVSVYPHWYLVVPFNA